MPPFRHSNAVEKAVAGKRRGRLTNHNFSVGYLQRVGVSPRFVGETSDTQIEGMLDGGEKHDANI